MLSRAHNVHRQRPQLPQCKLLKSSSLRVRKALAMLHTLQVRWVRCPCPVMRLRFFNRYMQLLWLLLSFMSHFQICSLRKTSVNFGKHRKTRWRYLDMGRNWAKHRDNMGQYGTTRRTAIDFRTRRWRWRAFCGIHRLRGQWRRRDEGTSSDSRFGLRLWSNGFRNWWRCQRVKDVRTFT